MIYTVTVNPSLDYVLLLDEINFASVNRSQREELFVGGKGINVAIILKNLGFTPVATGFTAGFTGEKIKEELSSLGVAHDFVNVKDGFSRINVKIRYKDETEINATGPSVTQDEVAALIQKLERLDAGDTLVLSGSIPSSLSYSLYAEIMEALKDKNIRIAVDCTDKALKATLSYHPFVIKPNIHEVADFFGVTFEKTREVIPYAKKLREMGAQNVLLSMGADGALLLDETGAIYEAGIPRGEKVNTVGSGDSMLAGFIASFLEKNDYKEALHAGICAGSASACSEGLASADKISSFMKQKIKLEKIN